MIQPTRATPRINPLYDVLFLVFVFSQGCGAPSEPPSGPMSPLMEQLRSRTPKDPVAEARRPKAYPMSPAGVSPKTHLASDEHFRLFQNDVLVDRPAQFESKLKTATDSFLQFDNGYRLIYRLPQGHIPLTGAGALLKLSYEPRFYAGAELASITLSEAGSLLFQFIQKGGQSPIRVEADGFVVSQTKKEIPLPANPSEKVGRPEVILTSHGRWIILDKGHLQFFSANGREYETILLNSLHTIPITNDSFEGPEFFLEYFVGLTK